MKQVLRKGLKEIVVVDVPDPVLQAHHVLIRPSFSLISSGTETASLHQEGVLSELRHNPSHLHKIAAAVKANGPQRTLAEVKAKFSEYAVLGYSGAGRVAAVDRHVTDIEPGQIVAFGGEGSGHGETVVAGRNLVVPVPPEVPVEHATFTTLGSIAMQAVRIAAPGLGERVVVVGLGIVGQLVAQLAQLHGARVIGVDLRPERMELATRLGAEHVVAADAAGDIRGVTDGRGADCVIVAAAAKSAGVCTQALEMCADRGRIVIVGAVPIEFPWHAMYMKEVKVFMSRAYGPGSYDPGYEKQGQDYPISYVRWTENRNMAEVLRLMAAGQLNVAPLITHEFDIGRAADAYNAILDPALKSVGVLIRYPAADQPAETAYLPRRRVEVLPRPHRAKQLRVAVVGAGNLARWVHLPVIGKLPDVELRAVCSLSGARGLSYATRFGARYCCADYGELLADPDVDAVFIITRNQHHASQTVAALQAGKHVFVEKPMALTLAECRAIEDAVRASGKQLTVGFNRRFAPMYIELKRRLQSRQTPAVINCRMNSPGISGTYWMADPAIGGAILGEACHFVDLLHWLLDVEPIRASAFTFPTGRPHPIGENNLTASLQFADGSIGNLTYCTVGSKTSGGERVEVFADGVGAATEDFARIDIRTSARHTRSHWWPDKGYAQLISGFVAAVRSGGVSPVTARDGSRATIGCLALLESAAGLTPVAVDLEAALARRD
jgi:predicted dehydrogenase/threonine dehydrogenase-like Zn-dependent dehydrogenase